MWSKRQTAGGQTMCCHFCRDDSGRPCTARGLYPLSFFHMPRFVYLHRSCLPAPIRVGIWSWVCGIRPVWALIGSSEPQNGHIATLDPPLIANYFDLTLGDFPWVHTQDGAPSFGFCLLRSGACMCRLQWHNPHPSFLCHSLPGKKYRVLLSSNASKIPSLLGVL